MATASTELAGPTRTIFVWRGGWHSDYSLERKVVCAWCETPLVAANSTTPKFPMPMTFTTPEGVRCPLCGWYSVIYPGWSYLDMSVDDYMETAILRTYDLDSPAIALSELGTHLRRRFADIYGLSWRRFEEMVADAFKNEGYQVELTQATRDGGADIILMRRDGPTAPDILVECKRNSKTRRVGVSVVRHLVGVAVKWGLHRASIVTTSDFSEEARREAMNYAKAAYAVEFDLVAAGDLVRMLGVYNEDLPPLHLLTEEQRKRIICLNESEGAG